MGGGLVFSDVSFDTQLSCVTAAAGHHEVKGFYGETVAHFSLTSVQRECSGHACSDGCLPVSVQEDPVRSCRGFSKFVNG